MLTETPRIAAIVYVISYTCAFPAVSHHLPEKAQKEEVDRLKEKQLSLFQLPFPLGLVSSPSYLSSEGEVGVVLMYVTCSSTYQ